MWRPGYSSTPISCCAGSRTPASKRNEPLAISDVTLLELAILLGHGSQRLDVGIDDLFAAIESGPEIRLLPLTFAIATEIAALGDALRDPADRALVATARVHRLKLVTSDQRIIESRLVAVLE